MTVYLLLILLLLLLLPQERTWFINRDQRGRVLSLVNPPNGLPGFLEWICGSSVRNHCGLSAAIDNGDTNGGDSEKPHMFTLDVGQGLCFPYKELSRRRTEESNSLTGMVLQIKVSIFLSQRFILFSKRLLSRGGAENQEEGDEARRRTRKTLPISTVVVVSL